MFGRRLVTIVTVILLTAWGVAALSVFLSFRTALEQQRERLMETAQSQARLIEAMARFDQRTAEHAGAPPSYVIDAALEQIRDAHAHYRGFGETGEFTVARLEDGWIDFLISHRHKGVGDSDSVPYDSPLAEPMRRALTGRSGTLIGLDYRGVEVLAAYEPIVELGLGIVAKIDIVEVRAPYLRAGALAATGALLIAVMASLMLGVTIPLARRSRYSERVLNRLEAVLEAISFAAEHFQRSGSSRDGLEEVLHRLAVSAGVGAVALFRNYEDDEDRLATRLEGQWTEPDPSGHRRDLRAFTYSLDGFERWSATLRAGEAIAGAVDGFPERERRHLLDQGIRSLVVVPVFVGREWWGFLGFYDCHSEPLSLWKTLEIDALHTAAHILGSAILRRQAEKTLVAVSRHEISQTLAGGIAHDFNNLMTAVLGGAEILRANLDSNAEAVEILDIIIDSAKEAGERAQQLLAFARGGKYQLVLTNLNDTVDNVSGLQGWRDLRAIRTVRDLAPDLSRIRADPTQMSQILTSLWSNAREAVEERRRRDPAFQTGEILVRTRNLELDEHFVRQHQGSRAGPVVCLSVTDDGCGIAAKDLGRVFEPFFSTKLTGRGLGLAAVYGIVKNHGGYVAATSGGTDKTVFDVYLPVAAAVAS